MAEKVEATGMDGVVDEITNFRKRWSHEPGMSEVPFPIELDEEGKALAQMYIDFEREELGEMEDALAEEDMVEVIDAMCDGLVYKIHAIHRMGLFPYFDAFFKEVSRSNHTKGDGDRLFDDTGRMIKGPGFEKPDLRRIFNELYGRRKEDDARVSSETDRDNPDSGGDRSVPVP